MREILLVSSPGKACDALFALLSKEQYILHIAENCAVARGKIQANKTDLVMINAPVGGESGLELAEDIAQNTTCAVLLLLKADGDPVWKDKALSLGVFTLEKPFSLPLFTQAIQFSLALRRRLTVLQSENASLQMKIEELRLIDRAKCTLIQYLGLSEPQAHRYIEKQAMDRRLPRVDVAKALLKAYET